MITPVGRRGLRRQCDSRILDRLALLTLAQDAGFSLDEIAPMLEGDATGLDRTALAAKADELDETIRRIETMRDNLRHMAACPPPDHLECENFVGLVRAGFARRRGA
ncbi:MAG: MerR family DNA-binding protein [Actinomycetota bacterium]